MSSELTPLPVDCSQQDFIRIVRDAVKLHQATTLFLTDACAYAVAKWGKTNGIAIAKKAAGIEEYSVKKRLLVAAAFPPESRFDGYDYSHYRRMLPFPVDFRDGFLKRHAGEGHSSRILRSMAAAEFNSKPVKKTEKKIPVSQPNRQVGIPDELYVRLRPFGSQKVNALIIRILEDWLKQQPAPAAVVHEPEPRPTYVQRRTAQLIADPSKKIPEKKSKAFKGKLHRAWTDCSGPTFVDAEGGAVKVKDGKHNATRFKTEAEASTAEREFFDASGFHELVAYCDVCKAWHVRHVYNHPAEAQEKSRPDCLSGCTNREL